MPKELSLAKLTIEALIMMMGKLDIDYWLYEIEDERIPLINWLHRN